MTLPILGIDIAKLKFNVCSSISVANASTKSFQTPKLDSSNSPPGSQNKAHRAFMPAWRPPGLTVRRSLCTSTPLGTRSASSTQPPSKPLPEAVCREPRLTV